MVRYQLVHHVCPPKSRCKPIFTMFKLLTTYSWYKRHVKHLEFPTFLLQFVIKRDPIFIKLTQTNTVCLNEMPKIACFYIFSEQRRKLSGDRSGVSEPVLHMLCQSLTLWCQTPLGWEYSIKNRLKWFLHHDLSFLHLFLCFCFSRVFLICFVFWSYKWLWS